MFYFLYETKQNEWCARGVGFASFYDLSSGLWTYSDSVVLFSVGLWTYSDNVVLFSIGLWTYSDSVVLFSIGLWTYSTVLFCFLLDFGPIPTVLFCFLLYFGPISTVLFCFLFSILFLEEVISDSIYLEPPDVIFFLYVTCPLNVFETSCLRNVLNDNNKLYLFHILS